MTDYRSMKLPNELIKDVIAFIEKHKELGYFTHTEFVKDATRRLLLELKAKYKE